MKLPAVWAETQDWTRLPATFDREGKGARYFEQGESNPADDWII